MLLDELFKYKHRNLFLVIIGFFLLCTFFTNKVSATSVSGTISSNTTWDASGSPYDLVGNILINNSATLTIDASGGPVVIQANGYYAIDITSGTLNSVGTISNSVTFTHVSNNSANSWYGIRFNSNATGSFAYTTIQYANIGIQTLDPTTHFTITDSVLNRNNFAIYATGGGYFTSLRTTYTNQTNSVMSVNPDSLGLITLGTGADSDIIGTGGNRNGFNAIDIGSINNTVNSCPSGCSIPGLSFAGYSSFPYYIPNALFFFVSGQTLNIGAGAIIKINTYYISASKINVNGTSGNPVTITSINDDSVGGDTSNNGPSTGGAGEWNGVYLSQSGSSLNYLNLFNSNNGLVLSGTSSAATVTNSLFQSNNKGISVSGAASLTTQSNTFNKNTYPLYISIDSLSLTNFGTGLNADTLGSGSNRNSYNAINISSNVNSCPSSCDITKKNFAGYNPIPYFVDGAIYVEASNQTVNIEAGVIIKLTGGNGYINIANASSKISINGTSGNPVTITSIYDDSVGGDTGNDGASSGGLGNWNFFALNGGGNIINYANILYSTKGTLLYSSTSSVTISNSVYESNNIGIISYNGASLTTQSNTFNKNGIAIDVNPESLSTTTFGSGAFQDTLGIGSNKNSYTGIGIGFGADTTSACPSGCTITSKNFAGINNVPYIVTNYSFTAASPLNIDPSVILKMTDGIYFYVSSNAININGNSSNHVYITSVHDDSIGGDSDNNGASSVYNGAWNAMILSSGGNHVINYAEIYGGNFALSDGSSVGSLTVKNTLFQNNNYGINSSGGSGLITENNTFNKSVFPIVINPESLSSSNLGSGPTADSLGTGANKNSYNAIGIGFAVNTINSCPSACTLAQKDFGGIANIPYVITNFAFNANSNLTINAGVILKIMDSSIIYMYQGSFQAVGSTNSRIYITSVHDDSIGGDTDNNGSSTGYVSAWNQLILYGGTSNNNCTFCVIRYASYGMVIYSATTSVIDTDINNNNYGIYVDTPSSPTFTRLNIESNVAYGMYNNNSNVVTATNLYWGSINGPNDNSATGQCGLNVSSGNNVTDTSSNPILYCPYTSTRFNSNTLPTATNVSINSNSASINLNAGTTKLVSCTATVTDPDGYTDIQSVEGRFFKTSVGASGTQNLTNRYVISGNSNCVPSGQSGNTANYSCNFNVEFFADSTDALSSSPSDDWTCLITPSDTYGAGTTASNTTEINTLTALSISNSINYSAINPGNDSGSSNPTTIIANTGNSKINFDISGIDMCSNYPICNAYFIPVNQQKYSGTPFTYSSGGTALSSSPSSLVVNLIKATADPSNSTYTLYWGIAIPGGTNPGTYNGQVTISASYVP